MYMYIGHFFIAWVAHSVHIIKCTFILCLCRVHRPPLIIFPHWPPIRHPVWTIDPTHPPSPPGISRRHSIIIRTDFDYTLCVCFVRETYFVHLLHVYSLCSTHIIDFYHYQMTSKFTGVYGGLEWDVTHMD